MKTRNKVVAGVVSAAAAVAIVVGIVSGGGGSGHIGTSLDASTSTTPPRDWAKGYTRTGAICYSQDATGTTSACFASNVLPYTTDATDTGWPIEPAQNNRFPINQGGACGGAPWVCATATMDSTATAPDGGADAIDVTFGGGTIDATATGYSNSTGLDLRFYAKCPGNGTLTVAHQGGTGSWTVDATAMGSGWNLLYPSAAVVTEGAAMQSDGSGNFRLRLSGVDCAFWGFTATEVTAYPRSTRFLGTIPTTDATGSSVGATAWTVDNSSGAYWAASGVDKTETGTIHNGTCWSYTEPTITLSGASTCHGIRYALSLTWQD